MKDVNKYYDVRELNDFKTLLSQSVELFPNNTAFKLKNSEGKFYDITYTEFEADIKALGTALFSMGLADQKIAVMGNNSYKWCTSYLAITCGVGVVVPIDKELLFDDIATILEISETSLIFVDTKSLVKIMEFKEKLNPNLKIVSFDLEDDTNGILSYNKILKNGRAIVKKGNTDYIDREVDPDALSSLIFTSGTTGLAKGVMLSQRNICFMLTALAKVVKIYPEDRLLSVLPIHHTYECSLGFLFTMYSGASIAFNESLLQMMRNMQDIEPTVFVCVPLMLEKIHARILKAASEKPGGKFALTLGKVITNAGNAVGVNMNDKIFKEIQKNFGGKLRLVIVGAAAVRSDVVKDFKTFGIPVYIGYGLTECAPLVAGNNDELQTSDTTGVPLPGIEMKIVNPDSEGIGEICVKSPSVFLGYYKDEKSTKEVIDEDGWFHTGDLGSIDKDGLVRITGRIKNVIVTKNGKNIYPEEVEYYLNNNPLVAEAMVVGSDDDEIGDIVVEAKIFPDINAIMEKMKIQNLTVEDISKAINDVIKEVNKKLPSYKNIKKFYIRETEFIKTTTAKIKRYANLNDETPTDDETPIEDATPINDEKPTK